MKKNKILLFSIIGVLLLLAFGNPSLKDFKEYVGQDDCNDYKLNVKRRKNLIIYSVYEFRFTQQRRRTDCISSKQTQSYQNMEGYYRGFLFNFYKK